ncbi:MAG TPA: thioesterase domain-containing protein, partial [Trichocoleus sp.]
PRPNRVQSPTKSASVAPRTVTEQSLAALWEKILNVRPVGATDNFFELGGNSLLAAYLFTEIEQVWGQALPISMLFEAPTLEQLATVLQNHTAPQEMRSLVPIQKGQGKPPLFCMHTRTGQVFEYYPLAQQLAPEQPVYGLQAPQVGGKAVFHASIEQMATPYLEEIRARQPQGPYFLCGYSFGGLIAYEVAQQLMEQGQTIELLALIDTYNTSQRWFQPLSRAGKVRQHLRNLQQLGWHNTLSYFQGRAAFKPIPDDNIQSLFLQANDRCEQLAAAYKPQPYSGRVLLFKASQQPTRDFMRSTITDPSLGWRALVPAGLEIQELPCDHFSLLKEPALNTLAAQLQAALGAAGAQRRFGSVTLRRAA